MRGDISNKLITYFVICFSGVKIKGKEIRSDKSEVGCEILDKIGLTEKMILSQPQ
jgi:hypothetical protein